MQNEQFIQPNATVNNLSQIAPTPNNPPWNVLTAIAVWLGSVAFIVVFPAIFLLPYLWKMHVNFSDQATAAEFAKTDPTAVLLQIVSVIPAHIFTLILAWLVVTRLKKFSFRQTLGWDVNSLKWWNYLIILGGIFVIASVVQYYFPAQENDLEQMLRVSKAVVYIVAFLATFTAPLIEEVIYRGVLYSAFQRTFGVPIGVTIATLLFALVHVPQYYPSYSTIFIICLLSLILTLIRAKTNNLLPCIILHTLFNGIQSVALVASTFFSENAPPTPEHAASFLKLFW